MRPLRGRDAAPAGPRCRLRGCLWPYSRGETLILPSLPFAGAPLQVRIRTAPTGDPAFCIPIEAVLTLPNSLSPHYIALTLDSHPQDRVYSPGSLRVVPALSPEGVDPACPRT